jgi:hypothetical protein
LLIAYNLLKAGRAYEDLSADYFDRINAEAPKRYLVKRLEGMRNHVVLIPTGAMGRGLPGIIFDGGRSVVTTAISVDQPSLH